LVGWVQLCAIPRISGTLRTRFVAARSRAGTEPTGGSPSEPGEEGHWCTSRSDSNRVQIPRARSVNAATKTAHDCHVGNAPVRGVVDGRPERLHLDSDRGSARRVAAVRPSGRVGLRPDTGTERHPNARDHRARPLLEVSRPEDRSMLRASPDTRPKTRASSPPVPNAGRYSKPYASGRAVRGSCSVFLQSSLQGHHQAPRRDQACHPRRRVRCTAAMLQVPVGGLTTRLLLAVLLQFVSIPAASHLLGRAARRTGTRPARPDVIDESTGP
jgi:hypothetical protein